MSASDRLHMFACLALALVCVLGIVITVVTGELRAAILGVLALACAVVSLRVSRRDRARR